MTRQYDYSRDPMEILISREEVAARRSCAGCQHSIVVFDRKICGLSITGKHGRRCSAYQEAAISRDPASTAEQA